eukprot:gene18811-22474_t
MSGAWQAQKGSQFMMDYYINTTKDRLMPTGDVFDGDLGMLQTVFSLLKFVAAIFRYDTFNLPQHADIQMHAFDNGLSTHVKADNWAQLKKFFNRRRLKIPDELVDAVLKKLVRKVLIVGRRITEPFLRDLSEDAQAVTRTVCLLQSIHGAAVELMELLFQLFTRKSVQRIPDPPEEEVNPTE